MLNKTKAVNIIQKQLTSFKGNSLFCQPIKCASSILSSVQQKKQSITNDSTAAEWIPIYKLKSITKFSSINKVKIYQGATTAVAVPIAMALEVAGNIPAGYAETIAAVGITGTLALCIANYFTQNFIGFAYVNAKQPDTVRLSHIDFWGRRKNVILLAGDIVPVFDQSKVPFDFWVPVQLVSNKVSYKLMHRHGEILDETKFNNVFGM